MAQAKHVPITSEQRPSPFVHAVTGAGAGRLVQLSGALRAIAELCWDGEGSEADSRPQVSRGDLSSLLWLIQRQVEAHADEVMGSIEVTN